jgi:hypothetical protein
MKTKREKVIELMNENEQNGWPMLRHFVCNFLFYADNVGWNYDCIARSLRANLDCTNVYYMQVIQDLIKICEVDIKTAKYTKIII